MMTGIYVIYCYILKIFKMSILHNVCKYWFYVFGKGFSTVLAHTFDFFFFSLWFFPTISSKEVDHLYSGSPYFLNFVNFSADGGAGISPVNKEILDRMGLFKPFLDLCSTDGLTNDSAKVIPKRNASIFFGFKNCKQSTSIYSYWVQKVSKCNFGRLSSLCLHSIWFQFLIHYISATFCEIVKAQVSLCYHQWLHAVTPVLKSLWYSSFSFLM